ncbi:MAG: aminoglycoside phosphotransferase family protein [Defluviitaleaceae bacterium]|nr:aminoglycoside phosphotransferase family protein [Defluviitaleaceae bacterium]
MNLSTWANILGIQENLLYILGEGDNSVVLTDGSGVVFKFPKSQVALRRLKAEIKITDYISKRLSVSVPEYKSTSLDGPIGEAYCTYNLIKGVPLSKEIYALHRQKQSKQLMSLLDEIHAISPLDVMYENKTNFEDMYNEIQTLLYPLIEDEAKRDIDLHFKTYLCGAQIHDNCAIHGDLGASNILCNPESGDITGIIDWAEASVDDMAIDYASLTCAVSIPLCKEDFLMLRPSLHSLFQRVNFIQYTFPLQAALHDIKTGKEAKHV